MREQAQDGDAVPEVEGGGDRVYGVVKWFDERMGFGFIDHPGGDVFVHRNELHIHGTLKEGAWVSYRVRRGPRGVAALDVRRARKRS